MISSKCIAGLVVLCALAGSCTNGPNPIQQVDAPHISRPYDYARKGLQITRVYYDEEANKEITGLYNEWVVVQGDSNMDTKGWSMDVGAKGRRYAFPDRLRKSVVIYTRERTVPLSDSEISLNLSEWIWNQHDTVRVYSRDALVAVLQY